MTSKCITENNWIKYYPTFNSTTEYLFINKMLTLIHGRLPDYAYYQSNDEIKNFWNELEYGKFPIIFTYLIEIDFIDTEIDNTDLSDENKKKIKKEVIDFVNFYFENRTL
jgi:hypothetical protein